MRYAFSLEWKASLSLSVSVGGGYWYIYIYICQCGAGAFLFLNGLFALAHPVPVCSLLLNIILEYLGYPSLKHPAKVCHNHELMFLVAVPLWPLLAAIPLSWPRSRGLETDGGRSCCACRSCV